MDDRLVNPLDVDDPGSVTVLREDLGELLVAVVGEDEDVC